MNCSPFIDHQLGVAVVSLALLPFSLCHADTLTLKDGDSLSGSISSITEEAISLLSPATPTPLQVRPDGIEQITFSNNAAAPVVHSELVTLKNGDVIPCSLLSLSDSTLELDTWFSGKLDTPRSSVSTLQFGITPEKIVFNDEPNLDDWKIERGKWNVISEKVNGFTQQKYECLERGSIAKQIDIPNNINISYDLEWQTSINFTFKFCADNTGRTEKQNSYHLFINYEGLKITRHQNDTKKTLLTKASKFNNLKEKKLSISINLNRDTGEIAALMNGKLIDKVAHDTLEPTQGNYMTFSIGSGDGFRISNFKITESTSSPNSKHGADQPSGASDLLIDNESNKFKGSIEFIKKKSPDDQFTIAFTSEDSPDQTLEIPAHRVRTLYFGQPDDEKETVKMPLKVTTIDKGSLQLSDIKFTDQKITGKHPDLGHCEIDIKAISSLKYQRSPSE